MSSENLTSDEERTNYHTMRHIERVRNLINGVVVELLDRAEKHDQCKLKSPEVELFTEYTPKLATCTYGSAEYEAFRKAMSSALAHHYANSRHHPEHFKNGINDMNLIDILEMLIDWKASSERHNDGNIRKSIEINANRFGMSPQLVKIFENTIEALWKE